MGALTTLDSRFVRSRVPIGLDTIDMVSTDLPPTLTPGVTVGLHVRFKTPTRVMAPRSPAAVFCHVTAGVKPLVLNGKLLNGRMRSMGTERHFLRHI
jgi:hypothetical protein